MKIYFFIGIMIITLATVGYGASLNASPSVNKIGSEDNADVGMPIVNVTHVVLNKSGGNVVSATVTVRNEDNPNTHTYKICIIVTANSNLTDDPGTTADCADTTSDPYNSSRSVTINLTNSVAANQLDYWNVSVQEIV